MSTSKKTSKALVPKAQAFFNQHASPARLEERALDRRIQLAWAQALLDHGVPDRLHDAWRALATLPPDDCTLLATMFDSMPMVLAACRDITMSILSDEPQPCGRCRKLFTQRELRPSPYQIAYESFCSDCLVQLDKQLARELAKRSIRSAVQRSTGSTLTDAQWQETCTHFDDRCAYCGFMHWRVVEHATPTVLGGGTHQFNVVPACYGCNAKKGARALEELDGVFDAEYLTKISVWLIQCGRGQSIAPVTKKAKQPKARREATAEEFQAYLEKKKER